MWNFLFFKSFGQGLASTARTCWTTVKLAWKAAPLLLVGVLLLFGVESGLTPLQLALSRAVIDKLAAPVGRTAELDPLVTHIPLTAWIALTLAVVALGQLVAPLTAHFLMENLTRWYDSPTSSPPLFLGLEEAPRRLHTFSGNDQWVVSSCTKG